VALATVDPQYRAATEDVALLDRSQTGKLALSGPGAVAFLDSVLSNDVAALSVDAGLTAALLTHNGRMLADVRVLRGEDELLLDTERVALQALFDALQQFRLGYDAQLHKRTLQCGLLSLIGPAADRALAAPPADAEHDQRVGELAGRAVRAIRTEIGVDLLCASEDTEAVVAELLAGGATAIDESTAETLRIERGRPRFGVEIDESTMPQEAGLHERTVSYTKGCYIGQETVARLYWKGRPNRHLRGLALSEPVSPGSTLLLGERPVGTLGSFASSPRFGPIGLALVRREADPGARLTFAEHAGTATVVELPFATGLA
jgi:folate-binding protein YgfZ